MYRYLGDTNTTMYNFLNAFSFFVLIIFNLTQYKYKKDFVGNLTIFVRDKFFKRKTKRSLFVLTILEILFISVVQKAFLGAINSAFGDWVGTGTNYFGVIFIEPFLLFLWFYITSVNPLRQMDLITPAFSFSLVFVKLACFCSGCCNGFECDWGLYYASADKTLFPAQLLEAAVALIIYFVLMKYRWKVKEGTLFPIYVIVYSATRFLTEFTRIEENVFWILKTYHLICLVGVLVGVIWLLIVRKYADGIIKLYEKAPFPWVNKKKTDYRKKKKVKKKVKRNKNGAPDKLKPMKKIF